MFDTVTSKYRLYYSSSAQRLADANIDEPISFGLAESARLLGPYTRVLKQPMLMHPHGAGFPIVNQHDQPGLAITGYGSLKFVAVKEAMIDDDGRGVALCNAITYNMTGNTDEQTGSTIALVRTTDGGLSWDVVKGWFIGPSYISEDWKEAYVYAFDTLLDPNDPDSILVYYNARNGWKGGVETVGVSKFPRSFIADAKKSG